MGLPARRQKYSVEEDLAIINYIICERKFDYVKGNTVWKELSTVMGRSFGSLENRYKKYIIPNLEKFKVDIDNVRKMRLPYLTNQIAGDSKACTRYTHREDLAILKYILVGERKYRCKGVNMWKELEQSDRIPGRTWQSLKNRYLSVLTKKLRNYLNDERSRLLEDALKGKVYNGDHLSISEESSEEEGVRRKSKQKGYNSDCYSISEESSEEANLHCKRNGVVSDGSSEEGRKANHIDGNRAGCSKENEEPTSKESNKKRTHTRQRVSRKRKRIYSSSDEGDSCCTQRSRVDGGTNQSSKNRHLSVLIERLPSSWIEKQARCSGNALKGTGNGYEGDHYSISRESSEEESLYCKTNEVVGDGSSDKDRNTNHISGNRAGCSKENEEPTSKESNKKRTYTRQRVSRNRVREVSSPQLLERLSDSSRSEDEDLYYSASNNKCGSTNKEIQEALSNGNEVVASASSRRKSLSDIDESEPGATGSGLEEYVSDGASTVIACSPLVRTPTVSLESCGTTVSNNLHTPSTDEIIALSPSPIQCVCQCPCPKCSRPYPDPSPPNVDSFQETTRVPEDRAMFSKTTRANFLYFR